MEWYSRFGMDKNPFNADPFSSDYTIVNFSKLVDDLLYYTAAGSMVLIQGEPGSGKTMMLLQVISRFKGQGKVVYINGNEIESDLDIERILNKKGGNLITQVIKGKPKGMILLLDDVHGLTASQFEKIKYYFDQDYIRSVIFTTSDMESLHLPPSILDRIDGRQIKIPPMINYDALRIVRERFSDHFFLPDSIILQIFEYSDKNIKTLLDNCDKVCSYVVSKGRGEVLPKYVKTALKIRASRKVEAIKTIEESRATNAAED